MKKKLNIIALVLLSLVSTPVFAAADCSAFKEITTPIYNIIMFAGPALVLVMGTIDFLKATTGGDDKAMKKAMSDLVKRLIICAILLILPILINFVIGFTVFNNIYACIEIKR